MFPFNRATISLLLLVTIIYAPAWTNLLVHGSEQEVPPKSDEQQQQQPQQESKTINQNTNDDKQLGFQNDTSLAEAYLFGSPEHEIDFSKAFNILYQLSKNGNPTAQLYLGFMYAAGLGVEPSQSRALVYYTFAAAYDNLFAKIALAYRYWSGISVYQSCETALKYYREVAKKVEEDFSFSGVHMIQRIRLYDEHENPSSYGSSIVDDDLIQYYQFLADKGDIQAQVGLGQLHFQGARGVEQDHQKALFYFKKAAESGNTNAMAYLGKIYLDGSATVDKNTDLAYEYFKKAADQENPVGQSGLGLMYLQGKGVPKDYMKAFEYFEAAAKKNWVDGHLQLGIMYHKGLGVKKDYRQALRYFQLASQSGHVLGFYNLAQMHAAGTGTIRDCRIAVELLKNVAERGHWGEKFMQAYQDHREGNAKASFVKYAFLSELGYEVAQSNAAFILDREELLSLFPKNDSYQRALMYWARSAAQGYVMARVKLGDHHYYGQGTKIDYEAAASHYRIASDQLNNAQAFFNLGYMHERGLGLKKDIHLAQRYYDLAAEASEEAQVPVALVKLKLKIINFWNTLKLMQLLDFVSEDWDFYVISLLLALLVGLLITRR
uniref:Protein sel-1 1 n=1 Tax=Aceria tosichella TaxID=561515 RepID=A0A6G1SFH4_9ACAR